MGKYEVSKKKRLRITKIRVVVLSVMFVALIIFLMVIAFENIAERQREKPENQYGFVYVGDEGLFRQIIGKPEGDILADDIQTYKVYADTFDMQYRTYDHGQYSWEEFEEMRQKDLDNEFLQSNISPTSKQETIQPLPNKAHYFVPYDLPLFGDDSQNKISEWEQWQEFRIFVYCKLDEEALAVTTEDIYMVFSNMERLPTDDAVEAYVKWYTEKGKNQMFAILEEFGVVKKDLIDGKYSIQEIAKISKIEEEVIRKSLSDMLEEVEHVGMNNVTILQYPELWEFVWAKK